MIHDGFTDSVAITLSNLYNMWVVKVRIFIDFMYNLKIIVDENKLGETCLSNLTEISTQILSEKCLHEEDEIKEIVFKVKK